MVIQCNQRNLCNNKYCELCFQRSFACSDKAKCWNYDLNNGVTPREVFLNSSKTFWLKCNTCPHYFCAKLAHISSDNSWCPYCANHVLCTNHKCEIAWKNHFYQMKKHNIGIVY